MKAACCLLVFLSFVATTVYVQYQNPDILSQIAPFAEEQQEEYKETPAKKDLKKSPQIFLINVIEQAMMLKVRHLQQQYHYQFTLDIFKPPQFV